MSDRIVESLQEVAQPLNTRRNLPQSLVIRANTTRSAGRGTRLAELDGLRALAVLPVIFSHCYPLEGWWRWASFAGETGWMGVDLFFVLSGYFITGILLDTLQAKHHYRDFILRRALRIFPLYCVCLTLFSVAISISATQWKAMQAWGGVGWFFVFAGNIRLAWTGAMPPVFSFGPLWSLQVEEQFYLFYPILVFRFSPHWLRNLLIGCVVAAPLLRTLLLVFVSGSGAARYVLTPCRMDALALGGLAALLNRSPLAGKLKFRAVGSAALLCGAGACYMAVISPGSYSAPMSSIGYTIIDLACVLMLLLILRWPTEAPARWFRWRPLAYTGRISYGLYLLHGPSSWVFRTIAERITGFHINGHSAISVPLTFASAFIAAGISWRCLEWPVLCLRKQLAPLDNSPFRAAGGSLQRAPAVFPS